VGLLPACSLPLPACCLPARCYCCCYCCCCHAVPSATHPLPPAPFHLLHTPRAYCIVAGPVMPNQFHSLPELSVMQTFHIPEVPAFLRNQTCSLLHLAWHAIPACRQPARGPGRSDETNTTITIFRMSAPAVIPQVCPTALPAHCTVAAAYLLLLLATFAAPCYYYRSCTPWPQLGHPPICPSSSL